MPKYKIEINFETHGEVTFPADAQILEDLERRVYLELAHLNPEFEPSKFIHAFYDCCSQCGWETSDPDAFHACENTGDPEEDACERS